MSSTPSVLRDVTGKLQKARRQRRLRILKWIAIGVAAVGLVVGAVYVLWFSNLLVAKKVVVEGNVLVSVESVEGTAQVPMGRQLIRIDTKAIEQRVATLPAVAQVKVRTAWPDTVKIQVSERVAVFQRSDSGTYFWVDANGVVFNESKEQNPDLPIVVTPIPDARLFADLATVFQSLSEELRAQLQRVSASAPDRIVVQLKGGVTVMWGSAERSELKSQVATALLTTKARSIDVSSPENPATRP